ncbi:type II toxin-antitoxin system HicB family antitoxin [Methanospirillum sp.]|uniref:type II toxin-antitoxin system HicB family antitoxin n=1 Tax=Methanospirillum sp. TaxID=45200 RepID=UPI002D1FA799|nr:type II toxin-antitoxin system HicB family antitoxin [Methanospirillum sp.]
MRKFQFKTQIWEEEGIYVSQCRDIEVASCGATPKEALDNLHEAIKLWQKNTKFLGI